MRMDACIHYFNGVVKEYADKKQVRKDRGSFWLMVPG